MTIARVLSLTILFGLPTYGAEARGIWREPAAPATDEAPEGYLPALSAAAGRLCVKQCPTDDLPCDPPSFKIADGRCTTQWR